jgi:hypothetical protein
MSDREEIEYHSGQVGMDYRNELDKEYIAKLEQENARLREAVHSVLDNSDTTITTRVLLNRVLKEKSE